MDGLGSLDGDRVDHQRRHQRAQETDEQRGVPPEPDQPPPLEQRDQQAREHEPGHARHHEVEHVLLDRPTEEAELGVGREHRRLGAKPLGDGRERRVDQARPATLSAPGGVEVER